MKKFGIILVACYLLANASLAAQTTPGTVSFSVTTVSNNAKYSPDHVLAIWIEDHAGNFVKTLKIRANKRKEHLYTWNVKSSGNIIDAVTGSTLTSHTTHQVTWDCTNTSGTTVIDGNYKVYIEYTSEHAQGPITSLDLTKSETDFSAQPSDATYFTGMDVTFTPGSTTAMADRDVFEAFKIYPVPARDHLNMSLVTPRNMEISVKIYTLDMKLVEEVLSGKLHSGEHQITIDLMNGKYVSGTYLIVLEGERFVSARRFIVG